MVYYHSSHTQTDLLTMRIDNTMIYLTDNGRALCGQHLGSSAKHTGRDISGQPIEPVTPEVATMARDEFGYIPSCEHCGREASLLATAGVL
ncbi:MAG TPA: hypothetical protein VIR54_31200 [Vicinamibacterales bacterium]|jgi:hypothetical protein